MIHDMLSKLQEQQAQDSRRDAWCKAELANTRESKAGILTDVTFRHGLSPLERNSVVGVHGRQAKPRELIR